VGLLERVDVGGVLATGRPLAVAGAVEIPAFGSYVFEPAKVALDIQRIDRSIAIGGSIETVVTGNCDRCLEDVRRTITVQVDETLAANGNAEGPLGDASLLDGTTLDLADLCRQLIDSALPLVLLCSDDCPGLCPMCGKPRREGACACTDLA
jgi:uncharacterized protein